MGCSARRAAIILNGMPRQHTVVNTIPSNDAVLRRLVDQATATSEPESAQDLTRRLRPLYPRVAVFERLISGDNGLYVYRDGRYEPDSPRSWWEAPDIPCVIVSLLSGELIRVTGSWAELMHEPPSDLVGRHYLDFVKPEARAIAGAMFEALQAEPEVRSEAVVQRADGSTLLIEFRAIRRGDEIEVCYRPLES